MDSGNTRRAPTVPPPQDEIALDAILDAIFEDEGSGAVGVSVGEGAPGDRFRPEFFVFHQQELARHALNLGAPGAARAAVRALQAVDFEDATMAHPWLQIVRDANAPLDEVVDAIKELLVMEPLGGFPPGEPERRSTGRGPRLVR